MTRPVFFSVGGKTDTEFATEVKRLLPDQLVYLYTRTGEEGIAFRPEIEAEIQSCRLFVVFWSVDYLGSDHARRELALFKRLHEKNPDEDRALLIVPRESEKPDIQSKWINPITQKADEFVLGEWRLERSLAPASDARKVAEHIRRKLEKYKVISSALIPRGHIIDTIKSAISLPDYMVREFIFVTGLEGHGRRTAIRQFMLTSFPNKTERQVSFDSSEGPEDLLIRLMDSASMTTHQRDQILRAIASGQTTHIKEIRKIIHAARDSNSYYVISVDRFSAIDSPAIPHWVRDVFGIFQEGNAPLVFFVTSSFVTDDVMLHYPGAGRVRIPGLDEDEIAELVHKLSLADPNPNRWTKQAKALVAEMSESSPSLCKTVMVAMASETNLDFLEAVAKRELDGFVLRMSTLLAHLVDQFKQRRNDLLALRIIEKLGVVSKRALDEILEPALLGQSYDLYLLREYGLVEQLVDGVYRIPPLLQRRLGSALWGAIKAEDVDRLFSQFAKRMLVSEDEYGAIYASNKVTTALRSGNAVPVEFDQYLTLATLFKAGLERYSQRDYKSSLQLLTRAMSRMLKVPSVDLTTQIEVARYFGLSSARRTNSTGVSQACVYLESTLSGSKRAEQAKAMASFIRGFQARLGRRYKDAVTEFKFALQQLKDIKGAERQRGAIYTELSAAYLRMTPPKLSEALEMAQKAFEQKDVTHTLYAYLHALILYVFRSGEYKDSPSLQPQLQQIEQLLRQLEDRCNETGQDFHVHVRDEYRTEKNDWDAVFKSGGAHPSSPPAASVSSIRQIEIDHP